MVRGRTKTSWWAGDPKLWSYPESLPVKVKRSSADLSQPKPVSKQVANPPLTFLWPPSSSRNLWPNFFFFFFPLAPPRPSPASALWDNTPSIWRWRTTHTCTVKQLLSGKELSSISCGSFFVVVGGGLSFFFKREYVFTFIFFLLYIPGCSFFANYVHRSWVERRSRGGTLATRIGAWRFGYRAEADLAKTHMHANVNPHQSWWGTHGV